jgi:hypothetical protein
VAITSFSVGSEVITPGFYRASPLISSFVEQTGRLDVLKALGDNTRYAIYLELARASSR